jgi:4-alpha-glucanotransferase
MGDSANEFIDFLSDAGCLVWQFLPTGPTSSIMGHSPYSSPSAFAGNISLVSPDLLVDWGLLSKSEAKSMEEPPSKQADFDRIYRKKLKMLYCSYVTFRRDDAYKTRFKELSDEFWNFCVREAYWLEDYSLFCVLRDLSGDLPWYKWQREYRTRDWSVLDSLKSEPDVAHKLDFCRFSQFIFFRQLENMSQICHDKDITLVSDMPLYVAHDSAEVWGRQDLFKLDDDGMPACVAGVPPDYFSETGQLWGNPIYKWDRMRDDGYYWWLGRFRHTLLNVDMMRIDHFRGLIGYWEIPAGEDTAVNGKWERGPGRDLFHAIKYCFADDNGKMPFIAEDLGVMTDDVMNVMKEFALSGMKVLHFAFSDGMPSNPYIPHHHTENCVVYAGTHDNNTTVGWWKDSATSEEKKNFLRYVGAKKTDANKVREQMLNMVISSVADLAVITPQDVLGLGSEARVNTPSTTVGNWSWRLETLDGLKEQAESIREMAIVYDRLDDPNDEEAVCVCDAL